MSDAVFAEFEENMAERMDERPELEARYHVPRSQVWGGSRGAQAGNVHLHVLGPLKAGRLVRASGQALCAKKHGSYERPPESHELACERCREIALRLELALPKVPDAG